MQRICECVRVCVYVSSFGECRLHVGNWYLVVNVLCVTPVSCVMSWVVEGYVCGGHGGRGDVVSVVWVIEKGCGDSVCAVIGGAEGRWCTWN